MSRRWLLLALPLLSGSCDDHLIGECGEGTATYEPTWIGVEEFLRTRCVTCHTEEGSGGFDIAQLVRDDLADEDDTNNLMVIPGDAEASVLWQSLAWTEGVSTMPQGSLSPLPDCLSGHVKEWINDGASLGAGEGVE